MNHHRTYCQMNPLTGIWPAYGNALYYRYVSPNGDKGCNQHLGARNISATTPPRWEDYGHTVFTAPPPQCADATTTLHSPFSIPNSSFSHTFSAKERDPETGYSYFGSRYYSSDLSVWLSVDPMAAKYPFLSSYVYCADNPVKLVDPNGMEYGNFVDENGSFLGTDGKNDGIVYAVADEAEQEMIRENNTKGINTDVSKVNSAMILPNAENRSLLVEMSQSCDNDYPNTENGGIWGYNLRPESMNQEELRWANQGYTGNPDIIGQSLSIDYNSVDDSWFKKMGFFHFHPSGNWVQEPSQADYENAVTEGYRVYGTSFVFGNDNYVVYMYNSKGYKMQMSFDNFVNAK